MRRILPRKVDPIPFTKEGFEKIKEEKKQLLIDRVDAVEHLKKSRELGDLSENGYYKASRQKLNFIDGRLRKIEHFLKYGQIIEVTQKETVEIGSTVNLTSNDGEVTYTIVGSEESNPSKGTISYKSPLGRSLLGKKKGEKVTLSVPAGQIVYTIKNNS